MLFKGHRTRPGSCLSLALLVLLVSVQVSQSNDQIKWKTFSNRSGWSILYPATWKIDSCVNCPDPTAPKVFVDFFPPPDQDFGWVMVEHLADKPSGMTVDNWFAQVKQTADLNPIAKEDRFSLNGLPALRVRYQQEKGWQIDEVYVVSGSQTFEVSFSGDKESQAQVEKLQNYPVYLKMMERFKVKR